jgi:hypothetical protein
VIRSSGGGFIGWLTLDNLRLFARDDLDQAARSRSLG